MPRATAGVYAGSVRRAATALTALAFAFALAHACAKPRPAGDTDLDAGSTPDAGGAPDAGGVITGTDAGCASDSACGAARWCEKTTGLCRDAKPCPQGQGNCDYQLDSAHPDYCGSSLCYCDPADTSCKPIHTPCSTCARSAECGDDRLAYDYPADCVSNFSQDGGTLCVPRRDGTMGCPPGYSTPSSGSYCVPAGGVCGGQGACASDADCDPHSSRPICNAQLGLCVGACSFDLLKGESTCPQGQVCHLTPALAQLGPQDANYGKGKCGAPCGASTVCGAGLVCRSEGVQASVQRCGLPPPACMGDVECPDSPGTNSWGYCDLAAHQCRTDCRANGDCHSGYLCSNFQCVAETCLQAGGAAHACDYGQFCCGEAESPAPCPASVDGGACYDKPAQTWCHTCSKDDDCRTPAFPPARDAGPNLCVQIAQNQNACALSCDPGHPAECPRGWPCTSVYAGCSSASDCARCDTDAGVCDCGSDADCPQGSTCRSGKCVITSVCKPACP